MPTLVGLRRRGVPPEAAQSREEPRGAEVEGVGRVLDMSPQAIRLFVDRTGVSKALNNIDYSAQQPRFPSPPLPPLSSDTTPRPLPPAQLLEGASRPSREGSEKVPRRFRYPTQVLEDCVRASLDSKAARVMAVREHTPDTHPPRTVHIGPSSHPPPHTPRPPRQVLDPLRVTVTSWPEGEVEMLEGAVLTPTRLELETKTNRHNQLAASG